MKQFIVGQVPDCCNLGNKYLEWVVTDYSFEHKKHFTGWSISVDSSLEVMKEGPILEHVSYCPFCGKKLERVE